MATPQFILQFEESSYTLDLDGQEIRQGVAIFRVSTRKIAEFASTYDFEYGYVEHLVSDALNQIKAGHTNVQLATSHKYSFTDGGEDWYAALQPDPQCDDPVAIIHVELG